MDNYYAQLFVDDGTFGIRNDSLKADNQPYVIRGIGQKWGNPDSSFPESIGTVTRGKLEAAPKHGDPFRPSTVNKLAVGKLQK